SSGSRRVRGCRAHGWVAALRAAELAGRGRSAAPVEYAVECASAAADAVSADTVAWIGERAAEWADANRAWATKAGSTSAGPTSAGSAEFRTLWPAGEPTADANAGRGLGATAVYIRRGVWAGRFQSVRI
ncbi:MAG: hypothetical protein J2O49_01530, partial [Sciscionella sp.]|nr:hypothetical protein [Sciscionella sp.]